MRGLRGFTLIELITVIVILAIVAAIGSGFIVTAVESYKATQERAKLVQKSRLAIEQMTRQLRIALPNSLRLSSSGDCIEFMPIVGGAIYLNPVPSAQNGASDTSIINTAPFDIGFGTGRHAVVGAARPDEIYINANPAARVATAVTMTSVGNPYTTVILAALHTFERNSINRRLFITDDPVRFCVDGNNLMRYGGYGVDTSTPPIANGNPGGTEAVLIAADVSAAGGGAFALSGGSEDRNAAVLMNLLFQQGDAGVELNHQVLVRNVP